MNNDNVEIIKAVMEVFIKYLHEYRINTKRAVEIIVISALSII